MRRPRWWIAALLGLAALALIVRAGTKRAGVLEDNRVFAARVLAGEEPYRDGLHTPYPPSFGIVMAPLLLLPQTASRVAFACLQIGCLALLWRMLRGWHTAAAPPRAVVLVGIVTLLVGSRFLLRDMKGGGTNLVFGTLVLLACFRPHELPGTDRRGFAGIGLGIGLGIVLAAKPTPLLFLPWLMLRGRWKTLAVALVTAAVLHATPLLTLGIDGYLAAYERWLRATWLFMTQQDVFAEPALQLPKFTWMNQALRCAIGRYLGTVPEVHASVVPHFFPGLGLAVPQVALVARAVSGALVAGTFWKLWRSRRRADPHAEAVALCLLVPLTLLLSPIAWKAHHVQLLPVFFVLLAIGVPWWRFVIYSVACTLLSHEVVGDSLGELMQALYLVTAGALWLWAEGFARLRDQTTAPARRLP